MKKYFLLVIAVLIISLVLTMKISNISFFSLSKNKYSPVGLSITPGTNPTLASSLAYNIFKPLVEGKIDYYLSNIRLLKRFNQVNYENLLLKITDSSLGTGARVYCGETVVIDFAVKLANTITLMEKKNYTLHIGSNDMHELELGIIGMRVNGIRIITPSELLQRELIAKYSVPVAKINLDATALPVNYQVMLHAIKDLYTKDPAELLTLDDMPSGHKAIMCGDKVTVEKYSLRNGNGEVIYNNTEALTFTAGKKQVPTAMDLGIIEMQPGSKRVVIAPSTLMHASSNMLTQVQKLPFDKTTMIFFSKVKCFPYKTK